MESDWKARIKTFIGVGVFYMPELGPVIGTVKETPDGCITIENPRMIIIDPASGMKGLSNLPGTPEQFIMFEGPRYVWPVKENLLDAYTKSVSKIQRVHAMPQSLLGRKPS